MFYDRIVCFAVGCFITLHYSYAIRCLIAFHITVVFRVAHGLRLTGGRGGEGGKEGEREGRFIQSVDAWRDIEKKAQVE